MNTRAFSLALLIAGIAMFMVWTYVEDKENDLISRYGIPKTVVVAKQDIKELELLDDSKVTTINVPQKFLAPGAFVRIKDIENTIATVPIMSGEQITKPRVTYPGAKTGLSRQVSVGKRAVAIQITDSQAVSKLIKPGDRVDILGAYDYSGGRKDKQNVQTILQDVLILSTGRSMTNDIPIFGIKTPQEIKKMNANVYDVYTTITLELTPYEVQKLVFVTNYMGSPPILVLRNNNDKQIIRIKNTDIFDVLGEEERVEAKQFFQQQTQRRTQ